MEHHYSLTTRMLVIFVTSLLVLGILLFLAGFLIGRETALSDPPSVPAGLTKGARNALPSALPAVPGKDGIPPGVAPAAKAAEGALRALDPAAGAVPPQPVPVPVPAAPVPVPKPSSNLVTPDADRVAEAKPAPDAVRAPPQRVQARSTPESASIPKQPQSMAKQVESEARGEVRNDARPEARGYVVYVGAFENQTGADVLVEELKNRKLNVQTSAVEKPGRKPMVTVWVGVFEDRSAARAALTAVRDAGITDPYIKSVP